MEYRGWGLSHTYPQAPTGLGFKPSWELPKMRHLSLQTILSERTHVRFTRVPRSGLIVLFPQMGHEAPQGIEATN